MQGRPYTAEITGPAAPFSAAIDVFEILAASGKPFALCGFEVGQTSEIGDAQEEQIILLLKYVTGAPTSGSGGSAPTFQRCNPNDAAPGAIIETANTTKLTGGTSVNLRRFAWNVRSDKPVIFTPEFYHVCDAGSRFVLEMVTTPTDAITSLAGWVEILELV